MVSYDENLPPVPEPQQLAEGLAMGLHHIHVFCVEDAEEGKLFGHFFAFVSSVPRIGEVLQLENGVKCQVDRVTHTATTMGKLLVLIPYVHAVRIPT